MFAQNLMTITYGQAEQVIAALNSIHYDLLLATFFLVIIILLAAVTVENTRKR